MEIIINGQPGLASVEDDAPLGGLFDHLKQELARQRMVVRSFKIDGTEVFPDQTNEFHERTAASVKTLEVEVDPVEVVALDILNELVTQVPMLPGEAVRITSQFQKGEVTQARDSLARLNNTVLYVVQALGNIRQVFNIELKALGDDKLDIEGTLSRLGTQLKDLAEALDTQDLATTGDVLEFDLAPSLEGLSAIVKRMEQHVEKKLRDIESQQGDATNGPAGNH